MYKFTKNTRNPQFTSTLVKCPDGVSVNGFLEVALRAENIRINCTVVRSLVKKFLIALFLRMRSHGVNLSEITYNGNHRYKGWSYRHYKIKCKDAIDNLRIDISGISKPDSAREFFNFMELPKNGLITITLVYDRFHSAHPGSRISETRIMFTNIETTQEQFPDQEIIMDYLQESPYEDT